MKISLQYFLIVALFISNLIAGQYQVLDKNTGLALEGVNISVKGTDFGFTTDSSGYYNFDSKNSGTIFIFSHIGYVTQERASTDLLKIPITYMVESAIEIMEIEVITEKLQWEQDNTPSITNKLDARHFVEQGTVEIKELLNRDPSVSIEENSAGRQSISIRGSNDDEVQIIYDGIPLNSNYSGSYDLSWLNLNDIENISIIKGASTLIYGSGLFGGVVLLEPKSPKEDVSFNIQKGSDDLNSFNISDNIIKKNFQTRLSYSSKKQYPFGYNNEDLISERIFKNIYSKYTLDASGNIISVNYLDILENIDNTTDYQQELQDEYYQMKYTGSLAFIDNNQFQYIHKNNTSSITNNMDSENRFSNDIGEKYDLIGFENKFVSNNFINVFKIEQKSTYYQASTYEENTKWDRREIHKIILDQTWSSFTDILRFRTKIDVPFVNFIDINYSFRYDDILTKNNHTASVDGEQFIDDGFKESFSKLSQRSGITLHKNRDDLNYQFFYTSGTNIRYPSLNDIYLRENTAIVMYNDTPLRAELNSSSEFGYQMEYKPGYSSYYLSSLELNVAYFKNKYTDKIYYKYIPRALPTPVNLSLSELTGIELNIIISFFNNIVRGYFGRTMLDISSYVIYPNKPEYKNIAELEINLKQVNFRIHYFKEGEQYIGGTSDNLTWDIFKSPGRENIDLYGSLRFSIMDSHFIFGANYQNILSNKEENYYFDRRRWTLSLGLTL